MSIATKITEIRAELPSQVELVAVSKMHPVEEIREAYDAGQRIFGESRPQELLTKYEILPKDIRWHMIGHLQTNKVKYIAPFVEIIHSVDSDKLMAEIDRQAKKCGRTIDVLFEVHLAGESTKSGWNPEALEKYLDDREYMKYENVRVRGLMTIGSLTDNKDTVAAEFRRLKQLFDSRKSQFGDCFDTVSMGMSHDYKTAVECGSTAVRIGSLIFGERHYSAI